MDDCPRRTVQLGVSNHPNRGRTTAASNPTPAEIRAARLAAGLSCPQAARLIHATPRAWQLWEAGERRMHPAFWDLFCLKIVLGLEITAHKPHPAAATARARCRR